MHSRAPSPSREVKGIVPFVFSIRCEDKIQTMGAVENPFVPGTATEPPHLAGREEQQNLISETLRLITKPLVKGKLERSPLAPIKIVGPRGAGKTTLLGVAGVEAQQLGIHVVNIARLRNLNPDSDIINGLLDGMDIREHALLWLNAFYQFSLSIFTARRKHYEKRTITRVLQQLLRRKPVLLLLDEAMHYDVASLGDLLQACQQMIMQKRPLAVMMAGTPALDGRLDQAEATFVKRCQQMYINQLSDEAVRDALRKPFLDNGVKQVSDEALDLMASWTDNYPYFVQLAGREVWKAMRKAERNEVDLALAQGAETAMQEERQGYYHGVYVKIGNTGVLAYASQVVAIVEAADPPLISEQVITELAAAHDDMSEERAREVFNLLLDNSLIWFMKEGKVGAAIPSFFQYVKDHQKPNKD